MNRRKRISNSSEDCAPHSKRTSRASRTLSKRVPVRTSRRSSNRQKPLNVDDIEIINCDNSVSSFDSSVYICSDDKPVTLPDDGDTQFKNNVLSCTEDSVCSTDILTVSNIKDTSTEPKKTARRGLAKKHPELSSTINTSSTYNASVYSQCVAENFKMSVQSFDLSNDVEKPESIPMSATQKNIPAVKRKPKNKVVKENSESLNGREDLNCTLNESLDTSIVIRSPTPPPTKKTPKTKRINKKLSKALDALSQVKGRLNKTPKSLRQGRKVSLENEVVLLYEEIMEEMVVKVRYLSTVHKLRMNMKETFKSLVTKVSLEIKEEEHNITLYLNDQKLKSSDCPKSVGLTVADIIECHCIKSDQNEVDSSDVINLVIRMSNKSKITIQANKRRPLQDVINKFAEIKGLDHSSLVFSFDGEEIDPMDTPYSMELESDDCIDVS